MKTIEEIKALRKWLHEQNYYYYTCDDPKVSDRTYNKKFNRLLSLEASNPELKDASSPTNVIGGFVIDEFKKVEHDMFMGSLKNILSYDDVSKIFKPDMVASTKEDGLAIELKFSFGYLVRGATRGDGHIGEDVTHNIMTIKSIPKYIPQLKNFESFLVYGEVEMPYAIFNEINKARIKSGEKPFANSRNLAAGSLRQLDSNVCKDRGLIFRAYDCFLQNVFEIGKNYYSECLEYLSDIGFDVVFWSKISTVKEFIKFAEALSHVEQKTPYDGVVLRYNDNELSESLGFSGKFPNYAWSYKFEEEEYETELLYIGWNVSRLGRLNPRGYIETIIIDGTEVSQCTLNNPDWIANMGLGIGDSIVVRKAKEIIPELIDNLTRSNTYVPPTKCPTCGGKVVTINDGEVNYLYCSNNQCSGKIIARLMYYGSRGCMDIQGLGYSACETLYEMGYRSPLGLYKFANDKQRQKEMKRLEGWGDKSVSEIVDSINSTREVQMEVFLKSLGIKHLGGRASESLASAIRDEYSDFDGDSNKLLAFIDSTNHEIDDLVIGMKGYGDALATSIKKFLTPLNRSIVEKLLMEVTLVEPQETSTVSDILKGEVVTISGKYFDTNRDAFAQLVESNGGKFLDKHTKEVTLFVIGDKPSQAKVDKAVEQGISMSMKAFEKRINRQ